MQRHCRGPRVGFRRPRVGAVANTGTIQVTVEDSDGGRLPGVTVTATGHRHDTRRTAVTDGQGVASLEALAPSTPICRHPSAAGLPEQAPGRKFLSAPARPRRSPFTLAVAGLTEVVEVTASSRWST